MPPQVPNVLDEADQRRRSAQPLEPFELRIVARPFVHNTVTSGQCIVGPDRAVGCG
jgi:hypothetical protein